MAPPAESSKESIFARAETQSELKLIEKQLVGIDNILQKLLDKLDALSDTVNATTLRLAVLDEKLKDYDNIKKSITDLQDSKTKITIFFSVGAFIISAITSVIIKLIH
jgi:vacuolar-type H+-ATPase subunit E/Vma4